jgi:hypothetical protein
MPRTVDPLTWALLGAVFFAAVGALFGAVAGALARASGRAPGGLLGNAVAQALGRLSRRSLLDPMTGAMIGAVDGASFLAVVGFILGTVVGYSDAASQFETAAILATGTVLLVLTAVLLGVLAYLFLWAGQRRMGACCVFVAGVLLGSFVEIRYQVHYALLLGTLAGVLLGILAAAVAGLHILKSDVAAHAATTEADDDFDDWPADGGRD